MRRGRGPGHRHPRVPREARSRGTRRLRVPRRRRAVRRHVGRSPRPCPVRRPSTSPSSRASSTSTSCSAWPERDRARRSVLYNAAAVIGPEGILGTYRKVHLGSLPWVTEGIAYRPGHVAAGVPDALRADRRADLLRLLVQPRAQPHPGAEGRAAVAQRGGTFAGPGKRDYRCRPRACGPRRTSCYAATANLVGGPGREDYSAEHLDQPRADRLPRAQRDRRARVPRFSQVYVEAGDTEEIVERDAQLREAAPLGAGVPDARMARRPPARAHRSLIADEFAALAKDAAVVTV